MARMSKIKISPRLRELIEEPCELENPDDDPYVATWNKLVEKYTQADPEDRLTMESSVRKAAAQALYGGEDPHSIPVQDLLYMARRCPSLVNTGANTNSTTQKFADRIKGPLTGIRAYCIDCQGGASSQVRECAARHCANWPFRMGSNPFFGKLPDADAMEDADAPENS